LLLGLRAAVRTGTEGEWGIMPLQQSLARDYARAML
jgi:hypothetical protein